MLDADRIAEDNKRIDDFSTFFTEGQLKAYQNGVMQYRYRGVPCLKSPIDLAIYLRLIHEASPGAIIEIGSKHGGSALLFRDIARMAQISCDIVSIDVKAPAVRFEGVRFVVGDIMDLESVFAANELDRLPRPWLVIEDSAHTRLACLAALRFFARRLRADEHLVIEDGILDELGLSEKHDGGPNRAIGEFMRRYPGVMSIESEYCDMFGRNATYNPNGYLRRTDTPFAEF